MVQKDRNQRVLIGLDWFGKIRDGSRTYFYTLDGPTVPDRKINKGEIVLHSPLVSHIIGFTHFTAEPLPDLVWNLLPDEDRNE